MFSGDPADVHGDVVVCGVADAAQTVGAVLHLPLRGPGVPADRTVHLAALLHHVCQQQHHQPPHLLPLLRSLQASTSQPATDQFRNLIKMCYQDVIRILARYLDKNLIKSW